MQKRSLRLEVVFHPPGQPSQETAIVVDGTIQARVRHASDSELAEALFAIEELVNAQLPNVRLRLELLD